MREISIKKGNNPLSLDLSNRRFSRIFAYGLKPSFKTIKKQ